MPSGIDPVVFPTKASIEKDWDDFVKKNHIQDSESYLDAVEMPYSCLSSLQIGVGTACNFNCPMCFNHYDREYAYYRNRELSLEEIEHLVKRNAPINELTFAVTGEPFLHKDMFKILDMAMPYVKCFSFSTNAGLLNKAKVERLSRYPIKYMYVSADGADRNTYEAFRKNGTFDLFVNNVKLLTDAFGEKVAIAATVFCENRDSLLSMPALCNRLGVSQLVLFKLFKHPGAAGKGINALNRKEMRQFLISMIEKAENNNVMLRWDTRAVDYPTAKYINEWTRGHYAKDLDIYKSACSLPFHNLLIDPEGNYNFCCALEPIFKNALTTPARQLYNTAEIKMMRVLNLLGKFPYVCRKYCGRIPDDNPDLSLDHLKRLVKKQKFESMDWQTVDGVTPGSKIIVAPFGGMTRELLSSGFFAASTLVAVADKAYESLSDGAMRLPVIGYEIITELSYDTLVITSGAFWREILYLFMGQKDWQDKQIYRIDNVERKLRRLVADKTLLW